jgi:hypothetical protein
MMEPTTKEHLDYLLTEARRQLKLGAYRMAQTWAYHARQLAGDDQDRSAQADALFAAAQRPV